MGFVKMKNLLIESLEKQTIYINKIKINNVIGKYLFNLQEYQDIFDSKQIKQSTITLYSEDLY